MRGDHAREGVVGFARNGCGFGCVEQVDTLTRSRYHETGLHGDADAFDDVPETRFSAPIKKRIWFHQGPLDGPSGDWIEEDHSHEYWPGDPPALAPDIQVELSSLDYASGRDPALERALNYKGR